MLKGGQTEQYFQLPLNTEGSLKIQGCIDYSTERSFIDWKTNWRMYDVEDNHQIGLYSWALSQIHGYETIEGSLFFLRCRKQIRRFFNQSKWERSRQWAENLAVEIEEKLLVLDIVQEAAEELFPARFSDACRHCPFVLECYTKQREDFQ